MSNHDVPAYGPASPSQNQKPPFPTIDGQSGCATRQQLDEAGWTRSARRWFLARRGDQPLPAVYHQAGHHLQAADWVIAGALHAGVDGVLTGLHAVGRHGLAVPQDAGAPVFLVPRTRRDERFDTCVLRRTTRPPRTRILQGVRTANLERALVDTGRLAQLRGDPLRALTIAALQSGHTTPDRLCAELAAGRRNGTAAVRQGVHDFTQGAWSLPEVCLGDLLRRRRPSLTFLPNPRIVAPDGTLIGKPDGLLPERLVALQVHSTQFHAGLDDSGRDQLATTLERDGEYLEYDILVVPVTPTTLRDHPGRFLARLDRVLAGRPVRCRPDLTIIPFRAE